MSSSASSSDIVPSSTSTNTSPLSNFDFDPFAVHPFTRYPNDRSNASSCRLEDCSTPHAPQSITPITPISSDQQSFPKLYATPPRPVFVPPRPAIFVPFRQETSSPDLSDVLKPKSEPPITKSSKTHPKSDTAAFIPAAPIGHSQRRK